jgi:hypothetical protein
MGWRTGSWSWFTVVFMEVCMALDKLALDIIVVIIGVNNLVQRDHRFSVVIIQGSRAWGKSLGSWPRTPEEGTGNKSYLQRIKIKYN